MNTKHLNWRRGQAYKLNELFAHNPDAGDFKMRCDICGTVTRIDNRKRYQWFKCKKCGGRDLTRVN